ncbi:Methionine aminopeptidase [Serratia entomophila]|uniref:type I methionyl aminopeptidase n=1 Tax=Serratia entomophila TaxID=42906 RepID=UPI00217A2938|nr:methionyl aminopeptidase [Serratia entomophila]CAI0908441.1 Methionine aminopeptidase [Serratia entomophila]CAI1595760.1 Methionine aminopeptidase [Serratia entomophila]CAI1733146.1 Methionine aminopeptidase [Serratia entomophila]CAI1746614.1 Methionine aminopeptidase [Serratia entomophila]
MKEIVIKTPEEIAKMRHSGALLARVFAMLDEVIGEGISTMEINDRAEAFIVNELKSRPASKGQYDFPYVLNTSIDEVVCHGIPSVSKILRAGMIVNVDITLENGGYIADSSKMYCIGQVTPLAKRLVNNVYESLWQGIRAVKPGATLGDIGHGIGRDMHEEPAVLHFGQPGTGMTLQEGMVFTIEPMINQGDHRIKQKKDGWTVVTRDKKLSAQWEHTLAVTADGVEILTLRDEERRAGYAERY